MQWRGVRRERRGWTLICAGSQCRLNYLQLCIQRERLPEERPDAVAQLEVARR